MAKKRKTPSPTARRIDPSEYGIDLPAIIEEIRPHLENVPRAEVSELAGMPYRSVCNTLNGSVKPSL
ncbi:hypothetical protein [Stieleria varia]|uniref:HTH cro/C1-type domain-containing protein n=1 Tax=Stieleria varia TaxID=2528005 RepID=A0A5C6B4K7_9BACT|nr:hypothetical protein [Stieleria varia]TWU06239.1 hypothetical protein Pla52n_19600 [Stieleria varia]